MSKVKNATPILPFAMARAVRADLCGGLKKRDWSNDRVYRRAGIGANLLAGENLAAELKRRKYSEAAIGKILGGNLLPVLSPVLPKSFADSR